MSSSGPAVPPHIVDAASHVLAQDGLAAATLERISAAAGVSRMTLHRRSVSKQDILRALTSASRPTTAMRCGRHWLRAVSLRSVCGSRWSACAT